MTAQEPEPPRPSLLTVLGPGLVTGASDDDPSGIGTYASAGARYGYDFLWTAPLLLPLVAAVQLTCARIGLVTGQGLAGVLRRHYGPHLLYPALLLLLVANTVNIGADLGAIAEAVNLLAPVATPVPVLVVPIALLILALQIWGSYRLIARVFKWTTLVLFAYVGAGILANPVWREVLAATLVPRIRLDAGFLTTLVAILGTTISPYLFFWQASTEIEDVTHRGGTVGDGGSRSDLRRAMVDTDVGMGLAVVVMYFTMLATGATLHASGQTEIASAAQAADALRPLAGDAAGTLFAIGLLGTGMLAVPVLSGSAAYAVAEGFGWPGGLDERPTHALRFYGVIIGTTGVGVLLNLLGINPINALFLAAVVNGVLAPPLLILIMLVANNRSVMKGRGNGPTANLLGWAAAVVMTVAAVASIVL